MAAGLGQHAASVPSSHPFPVPMTAPPTDAAPPARPARILVAPDSFKGSLGAAEAAERMAAGILREATGRSSFRAFVV